MLFIFMATIFISSCTSMTKSEVAKRSDYKPALSMAKVGNFEDALGNFPQQENGSFITILEKYWLSLLYQRDPNSAKLDQIAAVLEKRATTDISNKLTSLLYKEQTGNYYPSEHEAVLLHLALAMGKLKQGPKEKAALDLRRANRYLEASYGRDREAFDDPALRLWKASLWTAAGEWESAKVDLRVARKLLPEAKWLDKYLDTETPPRRMDIILTGFGPDLSWDTFGNEFNSSNSFANLKFHSPLQPSFELVSEDSKGSQKPDLTLPTVNWLKHHQDKNNLLYQALGRPRYAVEATATTAAAGVHLTGAALIAATTSLLSIGATIAIAPLMYEIAGMEGAFSSLGLALFGINESWNFYKSEKAKNEKYLEEGLGEIEYYRFLRFFPNYVAFKFSDRNDSDFNLKIENQIHKAKFLSFSHENTQITFHHTALGAKKYHKEITQRFYHKYNLVWYNASKEEMYSKLNCIKFADGVYIPKIHQFQKEKDLFSDINMAIHPEGVVSEIRSIVDGTSKIRPSTCRTKGKIRDAITEFFRKVYADDKLLHEY